MILSVSCCEPSWLECVTSAVASDGCAVVTDAIPTGQVADTRVAMTSVRQVIAAEVGAERLERANEAGVLRLMMRFDRRFIDLLALPPMLAVVDATVSETATLYLQNGLALPPEAALQPAVRFQHLFHRDFPRVLNGYLMSINCLLAIDPFTADNGATLVVLGSHQRSAAVDAAELECRAVPVLCPAGSMIVFDSTLWHAAGHNRTQRTRMAINHQFARSYLKPQIDYVRALGSAVIETLPPRTQQLLGWYTRVPTSLEEYYRAPGERLYRQGQG